MKKKRKDQAYIFVASFPGLPCFCYSVCIQYNTRKRKSCVFCFSSTSVYYTEHQPKNKNGGGPGLTCLYNTHYNIIQQFQSLVTNHCFTRTCQPIFRGFPLHCSETSSLFPWRLSDFCPTFCKMHRHRQGKTPMVYLLVKFIFHVDNPIFTAKNIWLK